MAQKKDRSEVKGNKIEQNPKEDLRIIKIRAFRQQMQLEQQMKLQKKVSRKHEINKKSQLPKERVTREISDSHPLAAILKRAKAEQEKINKTAIKPKDSVLIDINNMTVEDRVKILKLAKKKNNPLYRQLLMEKTSNPIVAVARQRKSQMTPSAKISDKNPTRKKKK